MKWLGFILGLLVGTSFGFWLHRFWIELGSVGAGRPPVYDFYLPLILLVIAIVVLVLAGRAGNPVESPQESSGA